MGYEICKCVMRDENRKAIPGYDPFRRRKEDRTRIGRIIRIFIYFRNGLN